MRKSNPREQGVPARLQLLADLAGSVVALAELTGVSRRSINDWLNSVRPPHSTLLIKICAATGADIGWLQGGEGAPPTHIKTTGPSTPSEFIKLVSLRDNPIKPIESVSRIWAQLHLGLNPEQILFLAALDNTMAPAITQNEPVLAQWIPQEERSSLIPDPHEIYVIELDGQPILRRVKPGKEPQTWLADKDNYQIRNFGKFRGLPIGLHQILGRAVWTGRRLKSTPIP